MSQRNLPSDDETHDSKVLCWIRTAFVDVQVVLDGLDNLLGAAKLAWRGAADLQQVLAHRLAIEHGVERAGLSVESVNG